MKILQILFPLLCLHFLLEYIMHNLSVTVMTTFFQSSRKTYFSYKNFKTKEAGEEEEGKEEKFTFLRFLNITYAYKWL